MKATLLLVGDDWQSIYGFGGSDPTLLKTFRNDESTAQTCLTRNFRSSERIVDFGKAFITRNPDQIHKDVKSAVKITPSEVEFLNINNLTTSIRKHAKNESILLLGRYNKDEPPGVVQGFKYSGYTNIEFMTIHKAKGLEADHVYFIFPEQWGFPSLIQDHPVFNLLKRHHEDYPYAEERRLMYVAISRAKKNLYIISPDRGQVPESPFINELKNIMTHWKKTAPGREHHSISLTGRST